MPISEGSDVPQQWDVVVLPFPYADRLAEKRRPGLIISKPQLARKHRIVWVVMITSAENASWDCDIPVAVLSAAGLSAGSVIRPWKLATIDVSRILRRSGRISEAEIAAVAAEVGKVSGF